MKTYFINEAFDYCISSYLETKNDRDSILYNSFYVTIINLLNLIYDELDIINPYLTRNEETLKDNLKKYGYEEAKIDAFLDKIQLFFEEKEIPNKYFIIIQKDLIDMLACKKNNMDIDKDILKDFKNNLYSSQTDNLLKISYNYLNTNNQDEVINYFDDKMIYSVKKEEVKERHLLDPKAYEIINVDFNEIIGKSAAEIDSYNNEIYKYFKIDLKAINKEYLLDESVKKYFKDREKITSGNGYVDILLVMGIIFTVILALTVITLIFV